MTARVTEIKRCIRGGSWALNWSANHILRAPYPGTTREDRSETLGFRAILLSRVLRGRNRITFSTKESYR